MFLAQQTSGGEPILDLIQYGVLGFVVVAFFLGWIWAAPAVKELLSRNKALEEENRQKDQELKEYRDKVESEVLPALIRTADVVAQALAREEARHNKT